MWETHEGRVEKVDKGFLFGKDLAISARWSFKLGGERRALAVDDLQVEGLCPV